MARSLPSKTGRVASEVKEPWIPGVEIFSRRVHPQRHRGFFGEFVRRDEGILARVGLWPKQWSAARMFAHTAKGFHVHPPERSGKRRRSGLVAPLVRR